jgi:hypothetical protein
MRFGHTALMLVLALASWPRAATARGWQGVTPGSSSESDVTSKFGQPSTQGKLSGRSALVYRGDQAIAGTRQAQFFLRDDGIVVEVVVFPANPLDRETVEGTYGHPTQKAFTEDFKTVWKYARSGVSVFFNKDGAVEAISFKAPEPGHGGADPQAAAPAKSPQGEPDEPDARAKP